jgi:acyl-CoA thioester hydrolase
MSYEFEISRRVEFSETDLAGIMHFSNFFRFMESAEHAFFRSLGFSVARSRNGLEVCLPRVHAECDYTAPLRFEDEVLVRLLVERKGRRSLTYQFRFSRLNGSHPQEVARGWLTVASVKRQADGAFKAVPLPKAIADKIQQAPTHILGDVFPPKANSASPRNGAPVSVPARNVRHLKTPGRSPALQPAVTKRASANQ